LCVLELMKIDLVDVAGDLRLDSRGQVQDPKETGKASKFQ